MKAFSIGWVPAGWTKGEPLQVHHSTGPNFVGVIARIPYNYHSMPQMVNEITVKVGIDDVEQAETWLEWWRSA